MKGWRENVVVTLGDMADADAQRASWLGGSGRQVPDPVELCCQLFDDTGLSIELASGTVFSSDCDQVLRRLGELLDAAQLEGKPSDILESPEWREIVSVARAALSCINALEPRDVEPRDGRK